MPAVGATAYDAMRVVGDDVYRQVPGAIIADDPSTQVEPNAKDTYGRMPLSWAAENGHEAVVKLLLSNENIEHIEHS